MARPRIHSEERVATAVRLPVPLRDELHRVAASRDVSVNYLINRAIENLLEQLGTQADPLHIDLSTGDAVSSSDSNLHLTDGANP